MAHRDAEGLGALLDGRRAQRLATARGAGRLTIDGGELVTGGDQRVERRNGEIGGSHEGDAHGASETLGKP